MHREKLLWKSPQKGGPAVIIGRVADYTLREENPFRIFISADEKIRVERVCKRDGLSESEALKST